MNFELVKEVFSHGTSWGEMAVNSIKGNIRFGIEQLNADPEKIYNASFGDADDVLDERNGGFSISGTHQLNRKISGMNVAIVGSTGCGKTSVNAICTCLHLMDGSAVIHDPSGQIKNTVGQDFVNRGFRVSVFDPDDAEHSISLNPLDGVRNQQDAHKVATHLIRCSLGDSSNEKFWELAGANVLKIMITLVLRQPKQFHNLRNVKFLLDCFAGNPKSVHALAVKLPADLYGEYRALVAGNERTLKSIIMTASSALNLWGNDGICKVTARTDLTLESFRRVPSVLFIKNATFSAQYNKPLVSLLIEQMFAQLMQELPEGKSQLPVSFIIDECATLRLDSLSQVVSNNRKYSLSLMLIFQNLSQVYTNFGRDAGNTILANCNSKLFYGGMDMNTAEQLCTLLGKRTVCNGQGKEIVADLMQATEIRMMTHEALFTCGANAPFKIRPLPFYLNPKLRKRTQGIPFEFINPNPIDSVLLLPLKDEQQST